MNSLDDVLINQFLFDKKDKNAPGLKTTTQSVRSNHFFCLNLFYYFQAHPKTLILTKFLIGFILLGIPFGVSALLLKYSLNNPDNPKFYISGILFIVSSTIIIAYFIMLIVFKILNMCRNS